MLIDWIQLIVLLFMCSGGGGGGVKLTLAKCRRHSLQTHNSIHPNRHLDALVPYTLHAHVLYLRQLITLAHTRYINVSSNSSKMHEFSAE